MRYYIRRDKNARVEGPFTIVSLTQRLQDGSILPDALASSDLGEAGTAIEVWRDCDWFPLSKIEALRIVVPEAPVLPVPKRHTPWWVGVVGFLGVALTVYNSSERGWFTYVCLGLWLVAITLEFVSYVWRRTKRTPTV